MNGLFKFSLSISIMLGLLAGCGTTENNTEDENIASEEENKDHDSKKDRVKEDEISKEEQEQNDQTIRILEENMKVTVNGSEKEETAFLKNSSNQTYSMYVLPDYELTSEEPNKDVLLYSKNQEIFMRIELLDATADMKVEEENIKSQLSTIHADIKEIDGPNDPFFQNSIAFEAANDKDIVTSYLIKTDNSPIKLTMFNKKDEDHRDAFTKMAKTILKQTN